MSCRHIRWGDFVTDGEALAAERVHEFLAQQPEQWYLFTNGVIAVGRQRREVDQIIVGPNGVFIVDVKSLWGKVTVEGDRWILSGGGSRRNPIGEVEHLAGQVKGRLTGNHPKLSRLWVDGRLLFTTSDFDLSEVPEANQKCFNLDTLQGLVSHTDPRRHDLSPDLVNQVVKEFDSAAYIRVRQSLTTVGEYSLAERIKGIDTPNRRSYLGQDRFGGPALVRVYDLSAIPPSNRQRALAQARSEFEALHAATRAHLPGIVRILTSFQEVPDFGEGLYYFALEHPTGATLADRLQDPDWPMTERLEAAVGLCDIVRRIHATAIPGRPDGVVVHRRLHPQIIFLREPPEPFVLTGFDVARATSETAYPGQTPFALSAYDAPELREGLHRASARSDVYSLGVLVYQLFTQRLPFGNRPRDLQADGSSVPLAPLNSTDADFEGLDELTALLDMMLSYRPEERIEELEVVIDMLRELQSASASIQRVQQREKRHPLPEDALLSDGLRVKQLLGRGAAAWAYLVVEEATGKEWVAKVLRNPTDDNLARVGREFGLLQLLNHAAIAQVVEVSCRQVAPFHLLLEYCKGEPFSEVFDLVPIIAQEQSLKPEELVCAWADTLLDALEQIHRSGILHRDLSPANLILTQQGPRIIDFGLATVGDEGEPLAETVGTFPYRPPECCRGTVWSAGADLYGLAVVLCQALFGRLPFEDDQGIRPDRVREDLFPPESALLRVFRRAVAPEPDVRFTSAAEFRQALLEARQAEEPIDAVKGEDAETCPPPVMLAPTGWNRIPYLDQLLQVYPASVLGAAETRGLDTPFARETYVPTRLDREVKTDILEGKLHLVLLSGNPGDGKTAFLQRLAEDLGVEAEATRGKREWSVTLESGLIVKANLDGSAAIGDRSSDEVLDEFLAPFLDGPPQGRVHLIAINDGKLLEWLERYDEDDRWLFENLRALVDEDPSTVPAPEITLIDLNERCLAGDLDHEDGSVARRVLRSLLEGTPDGSRKEEDPWASCATCLGATRCPVKFNVDTLRSSNGSTVIERAEQLLQAVHFKGKVHLTMRQLRGALSYWFFGTDRCETIHRVLQGEHTSGQSEEDTESLASSLEQALYFNRLFENETPATPLLRELSTLDPAEVDNPALDRRLYRMGPAHTCRELLPFPNRSSTSHEGSVAAREEFNLSWFRRLRRQVYFETPPQLLRNLGLDQVAMMIPLSSLAHFREIIAGERDEAEVRAYIARALSRADRVPEQVLEDGDFLGVRTHSEAPVATTFFRTLPIKDFAIRVDESRSPYVEFLPTHLHFEFRGEQGAELDISLELFQLIERLHLGYRLGAAELDALFGNLDVFRHRLLRMPTDEVIAYHSGYGLHYIRAEMKEGTRHLVLVKEGSFVDA